MDACIVFVSGHYPQVEYAVKTRALFTEYTTRHKYGFYYDEEIPTETRRHQLHFRRCNSILKAADAFPNAIWLIWVDSDVVVNRPEERIESHIDVTDSTILYHLFHEKPYPYPINTGVKIVNRAALPYEKQIYDLRNNIRWRTFPYEQNVMAKHILKQLNNKYKIHDPYILNCIVKIHQQYIPDALFVHMCNMTLWERNRYITNFLTQPT